MRLCKGMAFWLFAIVAVTRPAIALELNGVAAFSEFGQEVYLGGFYLDSRSTRESEALSDARERKIEIRFVSALSKRRWASTWTQSIAINNKRDVLVQSAQELSDVLSAFKGDLAPGDVVEIHYTPDQGTDFIINGVELMSGKSPGLFNLFLSSWIGGVPPSSHFKNALLGIEDSTPEKDRFRVISPDSGRIAAVSNWLPETNPAASVTAQSDTTPEAPATDDVPPLKQSSDIGSAPDTPAAPPPPKTEVKEVPKTPADTTVMAPTNPPAASADNAGEAPYSPSALDSGDIDDATYDDNQSLSAAGILAEQDYTTDVIGKIYRQVRYPSIAVKRGKEGSVRVALVVLASGKISSMKVIEEAGYGLLTREAERAIEAAAPFDRFPLTLAADELEIVVPITFKLAK